MRRALGAWLAKIADALLAEPAAAAPPSKTLREQMAEKGLDALGRPANGSVGIDLSIGEAKALNESGCLCTVRFLYVDANGAYSERSVDVTDIDDFYFYGFCHLRHDFRQFAWDRVQEEMVMVSTGEVLSADMLRARLSLPS
jgi:predicted DNA-binding transcriptional regulator YafY